MTNTATNPHYKKKKLESERVREGRRHLHVAQKSSLQQLLRTTLAHKSKARLTPSIDVAISRVCAVRRLFAMSVLRGRSNMLLFFSFFLFSFYFLFPDSESPCLTRVTRFLSWLAAPSTT